MDNFRQQVDFRNLLRQKLTAHLQQSGYHLSLDHQNEDQNLSKNWVFRLQYSGPNQIEIFNADWRDYTEYFTLAINGEIVAELNLNSFSNLEEAFEALASKLRNIV